MSRRVFYGPPGCGKTTLLLERMAEVRDRGAKPAEIGFFAFTRAAANEALHRLNISRSKTIRTLHSLAYEISGASREQMVDDAKLEEFSQYIGYPISGRSSQDPGPQLIGDELMELHNLATVTCTPIMEAWNRYRPDVDPGMAQLFSKGYTGWKNAYGYLDFNDLLEGATRTSPDLGLKELFLDEAQDLSLLQWRLVDEIAKHTPSVTFAGDDDQAIYAWAGADAHGMARRHEGAEVEVLSQSHRIPLTVHRLAQAVASKIGQRVEKVYSPRSEMGSLASWTSLAYLDAPGAQDTLVLYRNHTTRAEVEEWLIAHNTPYSIVGPGLSSAFEDRYANAVRAYLRLKEGSEISMAALGALKRVVRPSWRAQLLQAPGSITEAPWWDCLDIPYERAKYLSKVDLFSKAKVRVSTIHSAKGAEADHVILMNSMGARTYEAMDDNEVRVWYVGVTRARHRLDIIQGDNPFDLPVMECV
jgi:DNA helicase-2/ATP-dependent DNA helicase PcrA